MKFDPNNTIFTGPINKTGYGRASASLLNALLEIDPNLPFNVISNIDMFYELQTYSEFEPLRRRLAAGDYNKTSNREYNFIFWFFSHMQDFILANKRNIGYSTFEIDKFNDLSLSNIARLHSVGTATEWGRNVLVNSANLPSEITFSLPHGYNSELTSKVLGNTISKNFKNLNLPKDAEYYSNCGKFEVRKSCKEIIKKLELIDKPTVLIASWHHLILNNSIIGFTIRNYGYDLIAIKHDIKHYRKGDHHILLLPYTESQSDLYAYMSGPMDQHTTYLSLSKAEGWDLPLSDMTVLSESSSLIKNIITTLVCGKSEFLSNKTRFYLPDGEARALDPPYFDGSAKWANINITTPIVSYTVGEINDMISNNKLIHKKIDENGRVNTWRDIVNRYFQ